MLVHIKPLTTFPPLHSDTIFGSIIYSISQLYPDELEGIIDKFKSLNPPFMVSSAFPCIHLPEGKVKLFPRIIEEPVPADPENMKKFKKVEFIEEEIFLKWVSGEFKEQDIVENLDEYFLEENLLLKEEYPVEFSKNPIIVPKNSINRLNNQSESIFYSYGDNYRNMGLFFMVKILDEDYRSHVNASVKFLADRGFGRDISTGGGHFTYEIEENTTPEIEGERFVTLSRYIPSPDELESISQDSWFEIGSKRGRSSKGEIRKQIRFFREGSTFKSMDKEFCGRIVESGEKSVEYGLAYAFNMK